MRTYPPVLPAGASPEGVGEALEHLPDHPGNVYTSSRPDGVSGEQAAIPDN